MSAVDSPITAKEIAELPPIALGVKQAAAYLSVSEKWLRNLKAAGEGPPTFSFGKRDVHYLVSDLNEWVMQQAKKAQKTASDALEPPAKRKRGRPRSKQKTRLQILMAA